MKISLILSALSASTLAIGTAAAQQYNQGTEDTGFYLGGGYTYIDIETDNDADDFEDYFGDDDDVEVGGETNALFLRTGYAFTPYFSLEGEATFGIDDGEFDFDADEDDFDFDDNDDGDLEDTLRVGGDLGLDYLAALYGRFTYPVSDRIDLSARAGYAFAEIDTSFDDINGEEITVAGSSEGGFAFGAGAGFDLTESSTIRADYTRYEFDGANADGLSVAYEYKF